MNKEFVNDFFNIRDETLKDIQGNSYAWNRFIIYWSKILDDYSIDNILNLYSYNSSGRVFKTFDDWNSEEIGRRIKPKSRGIPIIVNDVKIYVFDIRQTYGKEYRTWNYNHYIDKDILNYYQDSYNIENDDSKTLYENFYDTFYEISLNQIMNNYKTMSSDEVEFVAKTMTSLFLAKSNFNINNLPTVYEMLENMETDDILKCMQIANKETANIYNDFIEKTDNLISIQNVIRENVLNQFKEDTFISEEQKQLLNMMLRERRKKKWALIHGIKWMDGMPLTIEMIKEFYQNDNLKKMLEDLVKKGYLKKEHPKTIVTEHTIFGDRQVRQQDTRKKAGYNIVAGKLSFEINKILDPQGIAPTLVAMDMKKIFVVDNGGVRPLTLREGLRLFGYPDDFKFPVSQEEGFDLLGNTVAVPVIAAVAERLANVYTKNK